MSVVIRYYLLNQLDANLITNAHQLKPAETGTVSTLVLLISLVSRLLHARSTTIEPDVNVLQGMKEMDFQDVQRSEKENVNTTSIVQITEHVFNTNVWILAIYLTLVVSKQSVRRHLIDLFVDVHQDGEEILTNSVTSMNAEKTLIVHLIKLV